MSASPPTEPPSSKLITGVDPILVPLPLPLSLALALVIALGCCSVVLTGEASTSGHIWDDAADGNDGHERQEIFIDGMVDGIVEAKTSIPNLDISKTLSAALDKMSQHWVTKSETEVEMKVYKEGIICGLQEASLCFPNLDKEATLNAVLNTETQSYDEVAMDLREYEGSDSEEEQESDPGQQEMRRILWEGMADGLLEAIRTFPALDIQTTIRTALNKTTWLPLNPQVEVNIYIKGIVKGLREAKLTCPTLDIQATLNVVLSRETHKGPPDTDTEAPLLQESWEGKALTELYLKLEEQYKALHSKLENEIAAMDADNCTSTFPLMRTQHDDELNSQSPPASNCRVMHSDIGSERVVSVYERLAAVLKGRAEDMGRLDIEGFQISKEFQEELSAIYMNGLRDGLLEAKAAIVFDEKEELVTDEEAKGEDNVKDVDNENIRNIDVDAAKRTSDSLSHEVITKAVLESLEKHPIISVDSSRRSKYFLTQSRRWIKNLFLSKPRNQKGTKLTSQEENLTGKTQFQEVEAERTTKQPNQAITTATEEAAKGNAAKDVIKSPTAQVEAEVYRLEELTSSKIDEILKKIAELEEIYQKTHLVPQFDCTVGDAVEALESGSVDPACMLEEIELQSTRVKEEAFIRKEIVEKVEEWLSAREEESWLEEFNMDENRYNTRRRTRLFSGWTKGAKARRGTRLTLKRAKKARALVGKIPAMVDILTSKIVEWEMDNGIEFRYDSIPLRSMLEDYTLSRQEANVSFG
ncbi:hypothetical protein RJT34_11026 [Clitoria ternatea]|uniref:Uncharacterized protein n=1 Tax=Clitoria ternatea TaxID=43366 RepID=A0AAN9JMS4_CLITE